MKSLRTEGFDAEVEEEEVVAFDSLRGACFTGVAGATGAWFSVTGGAGSGAVAAGGGATSAAAAGSGDETVPAGVMIQARPTTRKRSAAPIAIHFAGSSFLGTMTDG